MSLRLRQRQTQSHSRTGTKCRPDLVMAVSDTPVVRLTKVIIIGNVLGAIWARLHDWGSYKSFSSRLSCIFFYCSPVIFHRILCLLLKAVKENKAAFFIDSGHQNRVDIRVTISSFKHGLF